MNKEDKKSTFLKILRSLDVFGQPVILYIKGKSSYQTSAGGFITLVLFIITIILFSFSLNSLLQRTNITIQQQIQYKKTPRLLNFTHDNFMFSFGMEDASLTPTNSLFSYDIRLVTTINENPDHENPITTEDKIEFGICNENVYDKFAEFTKKHSLSRSFCPINYSYPIQGTNGDKIYRNIKILINQCVNNTHPDIICAPQDDINQYFKNTSQVKFRLYFVNQNIDLYNFDNPYESFIDNQLWFVSPLHTLARKSEIFFRPTIIEANDDLLGVYGPKTLETHTFMQDRYDWTYVPLANSTLYFEIELKASYYETLCSRTYGTFLEKLSFIGGIFNLLHLAFGIIAGFINEHAYRVRLANILYEFDSADLKPYQKNSKKTPNKQTKESRINNTSEKYFSKREMIQKRFDKIKELRTALIYPALHYLINKIWCCLSTNLMKKKDELFNLAYKKISCNIDIENIIRKLDEVEKLKNILLSPDQLGIFNFVETCVISTMNRRKHIEDFYDKKNILREDTILLESGNLSNLCRDLNQYYRHSQMYSLLKNEDNPMNKNLLSSLNPEVCEIFDLITKNKTSDTKKNEDGFLTENDNNNLVIANIPESNPNKSINNINEQENPISPDKINDNNNDEYYVNIVNNDNEIIDEGETQKDFKINKVKVNDKNGRQYINPSLNSNEISSKPIHYPNSELISEPNQNYSLQKIYTDKSKNGLICENLY